MQRPAPIGCGVVVREPVVFRSDGLRLFGTWERPESPGPSPTAVVLHGIAGTKVEPHRLLVKLGEALCERGIASLRFDFRGCGESGGRFEDTTFQGMLQDTGCALGWVRRYANADPARIALIGFSLGGALAAHLAACHASIRALVLWSPLAEYLPEWFAAHAREFAESGFADIQGDRVSRALVEELQRIRPLDALRNYAGPLLVVHGTGDQVVPVAHGTRYSQIPRGRAARADLHLIAGADHTFNRAAWEQEAIRVTATWLHQAFTGDGAGSLPTKVR